jgi:hypothetical protein
MMRGRVAVLQKSLDNSDFPDEAPPKGVGVMHTVGDDGIEQISLVEPEDTEDDALGYNESSRRTT